MNGMTKEEILRSPWAYNIDPSLLINIDEMALWLESMLSGPCGIWTEADGSTIVLSQRAFVARVKGMRLIINSNEHPPPHFHVKYDRNNVSFTISDCSLLAGDLGSRETAIVKHWHKHSRELLINIWNSSRPSDCTVGPYKE